MSKDEEMNGPGHNDFIESGLADNAPGLHANEESSLNLVSKDSDRVHVVSSNDNNSEQNQSLSGQSESDLTKTVENSIDRQGDTIDTDQNTALTADIRTCREESGTREDSSDKSDSNNVTGLSCVQEPGETKDEHSSGVSDSRDQSLNENTEKLIPKSETEGDNKENLKKEFSESQEEGSLEEKRDNKHEQTSDGSGREDQGLNEDKENLINKSESGSESKDHPKKENPGSQEEGDGVKGTYSTGQEDADKGNNDLNLDLSDNLTEEKHSRDAGDKLTTKSESPTSQNAVNDEISTKAETIADDVQDQTNVEIQQSKGNTPVDEDSEILGKNAVEDDGYEDDFEDTEQVNEKHMDNQEKSEKDIRQINNEKIVENQQSEVTTPLDDRIEIHDENVVKDDAYEDDFEDTEQINEKDKVDTENKIDKLEKDIQKIKNEEVVENQQSEVKTPLDDGSKIHGENVVKEDAYADDFEDTEQINEKDKVDIEESKDTLENNIQQAKDDSGKSVTDNKEADDTLAEKIQCDIKKPEEEVTNVVVDDEGIPNVLVTTVPDRPPSSQASDTERDKEQEDDDTFWDTADDSNVTKPDTKNVDASGYPDKEGTVLPGYLNDEADSQENKQVSSDATDTTKQLNDKDCKDGADSTSQSGDLNSEVCEEKKSEENNESLPTISNGKTKFTADSESKQSEPQEQTEETISENMDNGIENSAGGKTVDETEMDSAEAHVNKQDEHNNEQKTKGESESNPIVKETKSVESPLEKLLKRNVEIDGTIESVTQLEQNVVTLLVSMKEVMAHYSERLKLQTLREITEDIGKFRGDFLSVNEAFKSYSSMTTNINQKLKELRHVTEDVKTQINRKFVSEDLSTWVDVTPEQEKEKEELQDEMIADEKAAMMRAAEARQAMATATVGVAQANQFVTELQVQTAEAEAIAVKAAAQAKASIIAAEEARKAAEERRIAEELSKRRAEERARIKAEEARKKQAEEEMTIHMEAAKKGTSVDDERKKFLQEKAKKEEERRNPKNWPRYSFKVPGTDFNPDIGCVIRAIDGSMRKTDVQCEPINQSSDLVKLRENEELVSNIIRVKPSETDRKFSFEEPVSIALPVCFNRVMLGREAVVKQLLSSGAWKELPSTEVQFEDYRETKFIEGRTRTFGTFAVMLRLKKDTLTFTKKGVKLVSSVDTRISFTSQNGTFKQVSNGILEVQSLDVNTIAELKYRAPVECEALLTSSPIIKLTLPTKRLDKALALTLPLPSLQPRQTRPATAIAKPAATNDVRPATARPTTNKEEENPEDIRFVYKDDKNNWTVNNRIRPAQLKNKDIVSFDIQEPYERFVVLRTKQGLKDIAVEKMATLLERTITQRSVKVSLRQHKDEASEIAVVCTSSLKTDKALRNLEDEGFTDGPNPSPDLILQEGQHLYMKFRGNIQCISENPSFNLIFNSHIRATRKFQVTEIDVFAQKSIHCFRGFVQVFTKALVPKPPTEGTQKSPAAQPEMVEAEILLTELLVELPKPDAEPPKPLRVAPVPINDGPLTHLVFRHLASELGKEWRDLGTHLNLKATRIQAILRQNVNKDTPQTRYDMLVTWAKRIPKGIDKVQILHSALQACGRPDLAEEVRYKGDEFKQQRLNRARASHLRQAFVKVAKAHAVFSHWQKFAKRLGVPEEEIKRIEESDGSGQEKCFNSLQTWSETVGDKASIPELSTQLKQVKQQDLSREVESIMVA